jgi:hypothetical protein
VIEVHPPSEPVHGWRDFFIHLATITIGLLIALSLEGCIEFWHHRSLVHEAERSLHIEIASNAENLKTNVAELRKNRDALARDVMIMRRIIANPKVPNKETPTIDFTIGSFSDVSWKTAQSMGALAYMPYKVAHEYADIYDQQSVVYAAENDATRDLVLSVAPFVNLAHVAPQITVEDAALVKKRIEVLQAQSYVIESLIQELDKKYRIFLSAHPK